MNLNKTIMSKDLKKQSLLLKLKSSTWLDVVDRRINTDIFKEFEQLTVNMWTINQKVDAYLSLQAYTKKSITAKNHKTKRQQSRALKQALQKMKELKFWIQNSCEHIEHQIDYTNNLYVCYNLIQALNKMMVISTKQFQHNEQIESLMTTRHFEEYISFLLYHDNLITKKELYLLIIKLRLRTVPANYAMQLYEFEINNLDMMLKQTEFDGYHFISFTHSKDFKLKPATRYREAPGRRFDWESSPDFKFNFNNEKIEWDEQVLNFRQALQYFRITKTMDNALIWRSLRGNQQKNTNTWIATAIYMSLLKDSAPKTYEYLLSTGFQAKSVNVWDYITECKRFTSHLKFNFSTLKQLGIDPVLIFELEQLSGFRVDKREVNWKESIEDWIWEKRSCDLPTAAFNAKQLLNRQTAGKKGSKLDDFEILFSAGTYNSSGSAKGESISLQELQILKFKVPDKVPASKTALNLRLTNEERQIYIESEEVLFGYPILKKEVTKIRYIVNTDIKSHFMFAPIEKMMTRTIWTTDIFNQAERVEQLKMQRDWTTVQTFRIAVDQSSFDNYCSAHWFVHMLHHYQGLTASDSNMRKLLQRTVRNFAYRRIYVTDKEHMTRWSSGMLSGWKFTSFGDSTINLQQMAQTLWILGFTLDDYKITVLGDDVALQIDNVHADEVAFTMNALGLKQAPDKTISSTRFMEFLRTLYDAEEKKIYGYPTRLFPSLIYTKPWLTTYDAVEEDFGELISTMKNWLSLGFRLDSRKSVALIAAIAVDWKQRKDGKQVGRRRIQKALESENVVMKIWSDWRQVTKTEKVMQRKPKIDVENGNIWTLDLERWVYISRNEQFFGHLEQIEGYNSVNEDEIIPWFNFRATLTTTIPDLPFPKAWITKMIKTSKPAKFLKTSLTFGRPYWQQWYREKIAVEKILWRPDYYLNQYKVLSALKSELTYLPSQPDSFIADLKTKIRSQIVQEMLTIPEWKHKYTETLGRIDWNDYVKYVYGTTHIRV